MTRTPSLARAAAAVALALTGCGHDAAPSTPDAATPPDPPAPAPGFAQIEQLARPGINEALLLTEAFNAGYNATAPTFAGVPADTLNAVVGEAKTVLKALYLGGCLLNGLAGATADNGVHPAGLKCHAIGPAIWLADGVTLTQASKDAAQAYADKVFAQFIPDVLRVDTSVASNYLTPCGDLSSTPLLCGGRFLSDDVIDVTYNYLLNGAYHKAVTPVLMMQPYGRVVVLHLAILGGGFLVMLMGMPVAGLVLLIVLKIGLDVLAHATLNKLGSTKFTGGCSGLPSALKRTDAGER